MTDQSEAKIVGLGSLIGGLGRIGQTQNFSPTSVFCTKDGVLLQLWVTSHGSGNEQAREWRPISSFEDAAKTYNTVKIQGE